MRKPKTQLLSFVQRCMHKASIADSQGEDFLAKLEEKKEAARYDRREFLTRSLGGVAAGGFFLSLAPEIRAADLPRIAIIGGGIAGLNTAVTLLDARVRSNITIYEGSSGEQWGRMQTRDMGGGINAETGGEFIDTDHAEMIRLAERFRLKLINTQKETAGLKGDSYYFRGRYYSDTEVKNEFRRISAQIGRDNKSYESENAKITANLDNISIEGYLEKMRREVGFEGWFFDLLKAAYTSEFGMEIGEQSALNFITMIGTDPRAGFKIFGDSDELYKIDGGSKALIGAMRKLLGDRVENGRRLEAIKRNKSGKSGKYRLSFARGADVETDILVLALPFNQLRNVDVEKDLFTSEKIRAIKELGYGNSSKLLLPTSSRIWRNQYRSGYLFNEMVQNGWDYSLGQTANNGRGGYTVFLGGNVARSLDDGDAGRYVRELNRVFPGFDRVQDGHFAANWSRDEMSAGGYASYKTGQWTTISGEEITPQQNNTIFFCGEHCSSDYQGYMNGGAETGHAAAKEVIKKLGLRSPVKKGARKR